ncbi:prepilin-type N-terminal cleavage/methylation domain-containing protein [uncultured Gimesia sp.]|uniref:prepilin-type N-terminal cleavage/methylation domain-containing protein n=1 Tax=uncultured Gimesia sp. TaxID=1678688 RepID=UPI0030D79B72
MFSESPLLIELGRVRFCAERAPGSRGGLTLVELLMAMAISSILVVALGGIVTATQSAWKHTQGIEDSQAQITATFDRIKMMVSQAGIYQVSGQPPQVGLAVVTNSWNSIDIANTLVVWTGGRNGGISDQGTLTRLPKINELLIYTSDPDDAHNLIELALPDIDSSIDFNSSSFNSTIRSAISSNSAESALLSNRIKASQFILSGNPWGTPVGNIRFEIVKTPSDSNLSGVSPGTSAWMNLSWPQGTASATSGLRQIRINYEIQFETAERTALNDANSPTALPFFGSSSRYYAYVP